MPGQCDDYDYIPPSPGPIQGTGVTGISLLYTYARTDLYRRQAILAACPPSPALRSRYTHRLLFHSTRIENNRPASFSAWTTRQPVRPPTPARLGYLHTVGAIGSQALRLRPRRKPFHSPRWSLAGTATQSRIFFSLLVRSAPNEGWSCAEPGSSLQGLHLRSTSTATPCSLTFTYLYLPSWSSHTTHPIEVFSQLRLSASTCLSLLKAALTQQAIHAS